MASENVYCGLISMIALYFLSLFLCSAIALSIAYLAEYFWYILPCQLCIYQRYVFYAMGGFALIACAARKRLSVRLSLVISGLTMCCGCAISFFHSGVERQWFHYNSQCSTSSYDSIQHMKEVIEGAAFVKCDALGFQVFGLTMANYGAMLFLILSIINLVVLWKADMVKQS